MRKLPMFVDGSPFPQCHTAGCKILATCDPKLLHVCICVLLYQYFCDYGGEEVLKFGEDVADGMSGEDDCCDSVLKTSVLQSDGICRAIRVSWHLLEVLVKGQSGLPRRAATGGSKCERSSLLCESFFFFF